MNTKNSNVGYYRLLVVALLLCASVAHAQRGAFELTAGVGASINSAPSDNMPYKGNKIAPNYSALFNATYNIHRSMSAGVEVRSLQLSDKSDNLYLAGLPNTLVGGDGKRFVYAKNALSVCGVFNGKLNTYRGYYYGGAALGYGFTMHDAAQVKREKESFRTPGNGSGFVWGVQAGYTHGLTAVLGLNIEGALRNYSLNHSSASTFQPEIVFPANLQYNITAYTLTVGLKVRIVPKGKVQNDIPGMRGKGRSRTPRPAKR